jgi:Fur family transcriptional regulator, ferric uptake regulator
MASVPPTRSLADQLRSRGLRLTAQRQLVLDAVSALGHATPDQVHAQVARTAAGVNITTIYRTLELLERLGLVTHTHLSHGAPTYHAVGEEQHVHLVCRSCGRVAELSSQVLAPLAQTLSREQSFLVDIGHVALFGVCGACGGHGGGRAGSHGDGHGGSHGDGHGDAHGGRT